MYILSSLPALHKKCNIFFLLLCKEVKFVQEIMFLYYVTLQVSDILGDRHRNYIFTLSMLRLDIIH